MSVLPLSVICVRKIMDDETLSKVISSKHLPSSVLELLRAEERKRILSEWKWFVAPIEGKDTQVKFNMSPKTAEEFRVLVWSSHAQFSPCSKLEEYSGCVSNIIEFVREKGHIYTNSGTSIGGGRPATSSIDLYYRNPEYRIRTRSRYRVDPCEKFRIAHINIPCDGLGKMCVSIEALAEINKKARVKWNRQTYSKVRDFMIYYINQLAALTRRYNQYTNLDPKVEMDNRLYLAQHAKDEKEAREHLFGKYKGSKDTWLIFDEYLYKYD